MIIVIVMVVVVDGGDDAEMLFDLRNMLRAYHQPRLYFTLAGRLRAQMD